MRCDDMCLVLVGALMLTQAGIASDSRAMERAEIKHANSVATVTARSARPLEQALDAVREEYGWVVDFEDPIYKPSELVDDTDPQWRKDHPLAKGVTRPAGGDFTASLEESNPNEVLSLAGEARILETLVKAYNSSGNPGHFELKDSEGRYAIVGTTASAPGAGDPTSSIMDMPLDIEAKERNGAEAVGDILAAVSQKAGRKAELMSLPNNAFLQAKVTIGGSGTTARAFMTQVVNAISVPVYWELTYDADVDLYLMVITPATRVYHDAFGHRIETDGMAPLP